MGSDIDHHALAVTLLDVVPSLFPRDSLFVCVDKVDDKVRCYAVISSAAGRVGEGEGLVNRCPRPRPWPTLTVCSVSQLSVVKVRDAGLRVKRSLAGQVMVMVTSPEGAAESRTV